MFTTFRRVDFLFFVAPLQGVYPVVSAPAPPNGLSDRKHRSTNGHQQIGSLGHPVG